MIFDLDGVIADTHPIHKRAWKQALLEAGRVVVEEELDFVSEGRKREEILRYFLGSRSDAELFACGRRKDALFRQSMAELRPVPGVAYLLEELGKAHVPTAVATSASRSRTRLVLRHLGLERCFSVVVTAENIAKSKPDPSIFHLAADRLHKMPHQLLVAEDSVAGVHAARTAGMKCLGIAKGTAALRLCQEGAELVVPDLRRMSLARLQMLLQVSRSKDQPPSRPAEGAIKVSHANR